MPEVKERRAVLNRLVKTIDDKRKKVKKYYMTPYTNFETKVKELLSILAPAQDKLKKFVDENDTLKDEKKSILIQSAFEVAFKSLPNVKYEYIFEPRWLNKDVSLEQIEKEMLIKRNAIDEGAKILLASKDVYTMQGLEVLYRTQDLVKALQETSRLERIAKEIREDVSKNSQPKSVTLKVFGTLSQLLELRTYISSKGMTYEKVEDDE
jgi:hypothetical protein